jgi:uncharacterized protein (DUF1697 family)
MKTYILLFRSINVGGKNLLSMKALTELLTAEGFINVQTYIQSGNVVLQSTEKPGDSLSAAMNRTFGFAPKVFVLEKQELFAVVQGLPYNVTQGKTLHFYFCEERPVFDESSVRPLLAGEEDFAVAPKGVYLFAPGGLGRSKAAAKIAACLGERTTVRNWNTVLTLHRIATG